MKVVATSFQNSISLGSGSVDRYCGGLFTLKNQDFSRGIKTNFKSLRVFTLKKTYIYSMANFQSRTVKRLNGIQVDFTLIC